MRGKRSKAKPTSLAESQCTKDSAKAVNSADHKIFFQPTLCGLLETWDMRQRETPFCFSNFETKQKNWDFHTWYQDTSRFVLKNWDIRIKSVCRSALSVASYRHFFPDKNSQLAGLRLFFFFHEGKKKKKSGIPDKSGGRPSLLFFIYKLPRTISLFIR